LTSALILEDDVDWDVRIKDQLYDFALSAQALTQPLRGRAGAYADPTYRKPLEESPESVPEMNFYRLPATVPPTTSPYGDNWDLLWIGHCEMQFPFRHSKTIPKGRVIRLNDETVALKRKLWSFNIPFTLKETYPEHTRAYHHAQEGACSLGYALSQRGARKLLHEVALKDVSAGFDILLRWYCEGDKGRAPGRKCLTTQPALFHHHVPVGPVSALSDVENHGGGFRPTARTDMVRWSVRLNADALLEGKTDFVDQYPDD
jgi:hypothetical protein